MAVSLTAFRDHGCCIVLAGTRLAARRNDLPLTPALGPLGGPAREKAPESDILHRPPRETGAMTHLVCTL